MNLPERDLPDWCHWFAQDKDGSWWAYEVEPLLFDKGWYENELGRRLPLGKVDGHNDWKNSLTPVLPEILLRKSNEMIFW